MCCIDILAITSANLDEHANGEEPETVALTYLLTGAKRSS